MEKKDVEYEIDSLEKVKKQLFESLKVVITKQNEFRQLLSTSFCDDSSLGNKRDGVVGNGAKGSKKLDDL